MRTVGRMATSSAVLLLILLLALGAAHAAPSVSQTFSPSTLGTGDTSTLTITITNGDASSYAGVAFADTYPTNLVNASPANVQNTCGGTATGGQSGAGTVGLSGASIAAGTSCSITLNVTSGTAGSYTNSTGSITTTSSGTGSAASAVLTVLARPTIVKSFSVSSMAVGASATLSLALTNTNTTALSAVAYTDTFPAGLVIAAVPAATNSCNGSVTGATANGTFLSLGAGTLAGGATCTVTVAVTASAAGTYTNTAGGVASAQYSGAGSSSNSAVLNVLGPPLIAKSFSPNSVLQLAVSTLTITLTNPNAAALTGVAFSDTYPTGFGNVLLPNTTNSCGGTATGNSLAGSLSLSGGTLAANSSCTVSVSVSGTNAGNYTNVTGNVSSANGGTGTAASANLVIGGGFSIAKSFSPTRVAAGVSSTLTLTITDTLLQNQSGVAFSDTFPSGLVVASTPALANSCGGTITGATANSTALALTGGALTTLSTCTISVNVQSATPANYANTTGALSSTQQGTLAASNTATLQVVKAATIAKSFSPATILAGGTSTLSLVITNPDAIPLTGVGVSDTFPANLVVSATPTVTNSCGGTLSGTSSGSGSVSLSGATLAASGSCTISVQVTSAVLGSLSNTTGGVSANETSTGSASNTAVLLVAAPDLRVSKSHSGAFVVGSTGVYTVTVDNGLGTYATAGTITVTDTLPTGLSYLASGSGGTGWSCGNTGQVVTCTSALSIAAAATGTPITINVSVASTAVPSVTNNVSVSGGGEPAAKANNNLAADYTLVNAAGVSTLSTDGRQTSTAGTSVFYSHIFTAGYAGTVTFSTADASSPSVNGWSSSLFLDTSCNGLLDGTEGNTVLTGSVSVAAGGQVCLIDKVFIPATATYNAQDQTTVAAAFTPTSTGSAAALSRVDLTVVGSAGGAGLSLNKTVRNVTTGETASANDSAASGQTLEYTISYVNNGSNSLNVIVINDTTPNFTRFVSAQCGTPLPANLSGCSVSTQPAANAQGNLVWTFTGNLLGSASGSVLFRVLLQ